MPWKASSVMEERLAICGPPVGWGGHDRGLPGVRDLPQDRLQDFRALQGARPGGAQRSLQTAGALRQPTAGPDREPDCPSQGRQAALGARKIRELLVRRLDGNIRVPTKSTIHAVLDRHGLVRRGGGPRYRARHAALGRRCP